MPLSPRSRRLRKYRVQFAFGVLCLLAGAFILTVRDDLSSRLHLPAAGILGSAIVFFAYGTGVLLLMYLRGAINFGFLDSLFRVADETAEDTSRSRRPDQELAVIWSEVQRLHQQIASRTDIVLAQGEREELLSKVRTNLTSELAAELEQKYSVEYQNTAHLNEAREVFRSNAERLKQEIAALSRRGNLNLVIGVLTTSLAAALLVYTSVQATHNFTALPELLSYYIPRITTVIFIEVFAFFFLRLYRTSLAQLQYYQDELTRVAMYEVAIESAMRTQDNAILGSVLRRMITAPHVPKAGSANSDETATGEWDTKLIKHLIELVKTAQHSGH